MVIRVCECGSELSFGVCPSCGRYVPSDLAAESAAVHDYGGLRLLTDLGLLALLTPATSMTVGQYAVHDDGEGPMPGSPADLLGEWYDT